MWQKFVDWLKGLFSKPAVVDLPTNTPVAQPPTTGQTPLETYPPHLLMALKQLGRREGLDDDWIVNLFKYTNYKTNSSSTPWCAAFICWLMAMNRFQNNKSAAAFSQCRLGEKCPDNEIGAIMVWEHLTGSLKGHFHVNILIKKLDATTWQCVGGNQNNQVSVKKYGAPDYQLMASRRPLKELN